MIEDSSLVLPPRDPTEPPFIFPPGTLVMDAEPDTPLELVGPHLVASGRAGDGIATVRAFGTAIVHDLRVVNARTLGVELSPLGIQRRIAIAGHELVERVHVLSDRTCMVVEWVHVVDRDPDAAPTDAVPPDIHIEWWVGAADEGGRQDPQPPDRRIATQPGFRWLADDAGLRVDLENTSAIVIATGSHDTARVAAIPASAGQRLRCTLTAPVPAGLPLRLILTARAGDDAEAPLSPPRDVSGRIKARSAILRRRQREHIRLVSPDIDANQAVEWAKQRIDWIAGAGPGHGLAALAAGEFRLSRDLIAMQGRRQTSHGAIPGLEHESDVAPQRVSDIDTTAAWLQLVAHHLAWTGELALTQAVWPRVRAAVEWLSEAGLTPLPGWSADLVMAAESVGDTDTVRAIQMLRSRNAETGSVPIVFPASTSVASTTDALTAATPLTILVRDLLGAAPDAPRGRLRLRPAAPPSWTAYEVCGLRMGEASVDLRYRREGSRHEFRLDQPSGAIPIRVVFEPLIPGRAIISSTVDDQPASLVPRPHPAGLVVPVQIVLDHERSIMVEAAH